MRLRKVNGILVALCAARSVEKAGDVYLDDAVHYALSVKFHMDLGSTVYIGSEEAALIEREESNNSNRELWDKTYT